MVPPPSRARRGGAGRRGRWRREGGRARRGPRVVPEGKGGAAAAGGEGRGGEGAALAVIRVGERSVFLRVSAAL